MSFEELMSIDVVTTASKRHELPKDAPGIITVINHEEIKRYGYKNLFEVIVKMPSVYSRPSTTTGGLMGNIGLRGDTPVSGNHVLWLINGRPFRASYDGGGSQVLLKLFPIDLVRQVEFIRGPGSVLYGTNAYSGVVNIITKNSVPAPKFSVQADQTYSNNLDFDNAAVKSSISLQKHTETLNVISNIKYTDETGQIVSGYDTKGVLDSMHSSFNSVSGYARLMYKGFTVDFLASNQSQNFVGGIWPYQKNTSRTLFSNIGYTHTFSPTVSLNADLTYHNGLLEFPFTVLGNDVKSNPAKELLPLSPSLSAPTSISSQMLLGELSTNIELFKSAHVLLGGTFEINEGSGEGKTEEDYPNSLVVNSGQGLAKNSDAFLISSYYTIEHSAFVQADYKPFSNTKIIAGLQMNKLKNKDPDFVPRLGAIIQATNTMGFKLLWGKAFKKTYPTKTKFSIPGVFATPVEPLKPEKVTTADFEYFYQSNKIAVSASFFRSAHENLIAGNKDSNDVTRYENKGSKIIYGQDIVVKLFPVRNLTIELSNSNQFVDAIIPDFYRDVQPLSTFHAKSSYEFPLHITGAVHYTYYSPINNASINSERYENSNPNTGITGPVDVGKDLHLLDLYVNIPLSALCTLPYVKLNLSIFGNNLANENRLVNWGTANYLSAQSSRTIGTTVSAQF